MMGSKKSRNIITVLRVSTSTRVTTDEKIEYINTHFGANYKNYF